MIVTKKLTTRKHFEQIKVGDVLACEFHLNVHDYPKKPYRFGVFTVCEVKERQHEIILQKRNNVYFNYEMFLAKGSILKSALLIKQK